MSVADKHLVLFGAEGACSGQDLFQTLAFFLVFVSAAKVVIAASSNDILATEERPEERQKGADAVPALARRRKPAQAPFCQGLKGQKSETPSLHQEDFRESGGEDNLKDGPERSAKKERCLSWQTVTQPATQAKHQVASASSCSAHLA